MSLLVAGLIQYLKHILFSSLLPSPEMLKASQHIESVAAHVDSLVVVNREQQDSIIILNDSIVVLNDSLVRVNGELVDVRGRLADCEKAGKGGKPASKPCPCEKQEKPTHIYWDSDVAKWIEACAYVLARKDDEQLRAWYEEAVCDLVKNQRKDGYFNSYFQ